MKYKDIKETGLSLDDILEKFGEETVGDIINAEIRKCSVAEIQDRRKTDSLFDELVVYATVRIAATNPAVRKDMEASLCKAFPELEGIFNATDKMKSNVTLH